MLGNAEALDRVGKREPHRGPVLAAIDAVADDEVGIEVLHGDQVRPRDRAVRPAHEHVHAMSVGVDRLHGVKHRAVAHHVRESALGGFAASAFERDDAGRHLAIKPAS